MKSGNNSAGKPPKIKKYKVVEDVIENDSPPPEFITVYYIELTQSGKRLDKIYYKLEDAEYECDYQNGLENTI